MIPSPRKLPSPPSAQRYICNVCRSEIVCRSESTDFNLLKYTEHSNILEEFYTKFEYISKHISNIDKSISDHPALINSLERDYVCLLMCA